MINKILDFFYRKTKQEQKFQEDFDDNPLSQILKIHSNFANFDDIPNPGKFRPKQPKDKFWIKKRRLIVTNEVSTIFYSLMTDKNINELAKALQFDEEILESRNQEAIAKHLGEAYSLADFIHPFNDGNSRTLRKYFYDTLIDYNININWDIYNTDDYSRDMLYIARDLSVNEIAKYRFSDYFVQSEINKHTKMFEDRDIRMSDIFEEIITFSGDKDDLDTENKPIQFDPH